MSPNALKAYAQYTTKYNLKPTLNSYPILCFIDQNGLLVKKHIEAVYNDLGWSVSPTTGKWSPAKNKKEKLDGSK